MSNIVSPAQRLPVDVLHSIVRYVVNERRKPFGGVSSDKRKLKALLPVCVNWRQVALEYLWNEVILTLNPKSSGVHLNRPSWVKPNVLSQSTANLVREFHISVHMSGIVNGAAHKCLLKYLGGTECYPSAHKLAVEVYFVKGDPLKENVSDNVLAFAQLLKGLVPVAQTIEVVCATKDVPMGCHDDPKGGLNEANFGTFVNLLYCDSKRLKLNTGYILFSHKPLIDCIPQLSWLTVWCDKSMYLSMELVHKSANTLQHLDIEVAIPRSLFYDANGSDVVYPRLQHLRLSFCDYKAKETRPVSSEIVPFPVLKRLIIDSIYSFDDDVVFRGNSATLEYLDLEISSSLEKVCNSSRVFENRHKALRHVIIGYDYGEDELYSISEENMNRLLNNLVSNAKRLTISTRTWLQYALKAMQHGHGFQNISVFEARFKDMSLLDVLRIIKGLPTMTKLRSAIGGMGYGLINFAEEELPDHIVSTYGDMNNNLQVWEMTTFDIRFEDEIITYILLLALVCPKLRRVELQPNSVPDSYGRITEALERGSFNKYASQLNHVSDIIYEQRSNFLVFK